MIQVDQRRGEYPNKIGVRPGLYLLVTELRWEYWKFAVVLEANVESSDGVG
jgi:hypothetical protein